MLRLISVCVGAALLVQPAAAGAIDERVFSAFETLCLDNMREIAECHLLRVQLGWLN
jgi:hypothetical protein